MACNTSEVRVTRSTWCFEKVNNAHYKIEFEDPIPVGRPSLLYLQIDWEPDWKEGEVKLKFRKQNESSGGADVRFNDDNGSVERIFRGDISPQLITIYGKSATLGENADLMLDVTAHEEQQPPIPIMVRQEQRVGADEGITLLKQETTIAAMVQKGKGILALDESSPTIAKRFKAIDVESTEENRRAYRSLILSTPELSDYVSGVILFEETLEQFSDDGIRLPELCAQQGIVPGIKVDKGKLPMPNAAGDEITQGLDGLEQRLKGYKELGARFAKWRNVYHIAQMTPSRLAIEANAEVLARYAAICQAQGIVPIVEPEVLIDGDHSLNRCSEVSEVVF